MVTGGANVATPTSHAVSSANTGQVSAEGATASIHCRGCLPGRASDKPATTANLPVTTVSRSNAKQQRIRIPARRGPNIAAVEEVHWHVFLPGPLCRHRQRFCCARTDVWQRDPLAAYFSVIRARPRRLTLVLPRRGEALQFLLQRASIAVRCNASMVPGALLTLAMPPTICQAPTRTRRMLHAPCPNTPKVWQSLQCARPHTQLAGACSQRATDERQAAGGGSVPSKLTP